jgi:RNA polymerase sigma factor (sigma-70 family)
VTDPRTVENLLRELAPQVLAALVRRYGQFHLAEEATQEALLAAATQWAELPDNPRGWLLTVATRRLIDEMRSDQSRRQRELATPQSEVLAGQDQDDSLALLFGCCHSDLSAPSQIALTLRAVGGLSTAQIAAAFGVPETTMAQRISRAKQVVREAGFTLHGDRARLPAVLHVLYLVFSEGYTASDGDSVTVPALSDEAIRLTRWLHRLAPDEAEVTGLLALMLLTDARRPARTRPDGSLVPLAEQDRALWDHGKIAEGTALTEQALASGNVGPYQLQAAIAAVHDEAATMDDTDWPQILGLYDLLELAAPNPFTTLNRAVAVAEVHGPAQAMKLLDPLSADKRTARNHRLFATRAHLQEMAGDSQAAAASYQQAARLATSLPERRFLATQARRLDAGRLSASLGNQLGAAVQGREIGGGTAGGPAFLVGRPQAAAAGDVGEHALHRLGHLTLAAGQHRQQVALRLLFRDRLLGGGSRLGQPLTDPDRVGDQERLPERTGPAAA